MLCFLLAKQVGIGFYGRILDLRHHLPDGLDEITLEAGRNQGDEIDEVAPVRIVRIGLERDITAELKIDLTNCQRTDLVSGHGEHLQNHGYKQ